MKLLNPQSDTAERSPQLPTQPAPKPAFETPVMDTTLDLLDRAAEIELMRIAATGKPVPLAYNEVRGMAIALAHWSASFGRWSCLHIAWVALRAMFIPVWKRQRRHFHDHRASKKPHYTSAHGFTYL